MSIPNKGSCIPKRDLENVSDQLQEVLTKVQSARRHLPFLSVPDVYLYRAEEMLQEVLEKLRES